MDGRSHRTHRRHRPRGDDGYSVLEAIITLPAMVLLLMIVFQFAIVWYADGIAQTAAQEALQTAQAYQTNGDATQQNAAGVAAGKSIINQTSPRALPGATVTVTRDVNAGTVTAEVKSTVPSIFGSFLSVPVDEKATGPIEAFRPST
jgi:Flp pilus assembly protein TadG